MYEKRPETVTRNGGSDVRGGRPRGLRWFGIICMASILLIGVGCTRSVGPGYSPKLLRSHPDYVKAVAISPDGERVLSISLDGALSVWAIRSGERIDDGQIPCRSPQCMAVSPDGRWLAVAGVDGEVVALDAESLTERSRFTGHQDEVVSVSISHDGKNIASASRDGTVRIWDVKDGRAVHTVRPDAGDGAPRAVAFSPAGPLLACAMGGKVMLLSGPDWRRERDFMGGDPDLGIYSICFSPDGKKLAIGNHARVDIWNVRKSRLDRRIRGHSGRVTAVAFSPDGRLIASGGGIQHYDSNILLYRSSSGRKLATIAVHQMPVVSLAFSPDGRWLASGSWDQTVGLFNLTKIVR